MKFSLSTSFSKLALFTLLSIFLLTIGGRLVAIDGGSAACATWPLCLPVGMSAWAQIFHRVSAALSAVLVIALLFHAWRSQRDRNRWLQTSGIEARMLPSSARVWWATHHRSM